jgi:hypothetical protein
MRSWRIPASLIVTLALALPGRAQSLDLSEAPQAGSYFDIQLTLDLTGEVRVQKDGKESVLKEIVRATHAFAERVLEAPEHGLATRAARVYKDARAIFAIAEDRSERTLRADRRLLVAQRGKEQLVTYCPAGPLKPEELELIQHFDTLAVAGLLPDKHANVGETWKVASAVVQALCQFDGLISQDFEGSLEQVTEERARVLIRGTATGIDSGAVVKTTVRAECDLERRYRRLVSVKWKQTDEREQGPTSPAMSLSSTLTLTRTPINPIPSLHDYALTAVPEGPIPPEKMTALVYRDARQRFEMVYARDWRLVAHTDQFVVMRLMDRGDFVAQVTITPLRPAEAGKGLSDDEFKELVNATPGWEPEAEAKVEEITVPAGKNPAADYTLKRLAAQGKLDGLKTTQFCYLLSSPQGDQVVVAFTTTPAQAGALDGRDLALVRGITFISRKEP